MMDLVAKAAFCLFGAGAVSVGLYGLVRAYRSTRWPKAIGTIVSSAVEAYRDSKGTTMCRAAISYRYSVAGREYVGSRRIFGGEMGVSWSGPAETTIAAYPTGATVTVHYDPDRPGEAVLLPGRYKVPLFAIGFGALFLLLGLFVW